MASLKIPFIPAQIRKALLDAQAQGVEIGEIRSHTDGSLSFVAKLADEQPLEATDAATRAKGIEDGILHLVQSKTGAVVAVPIRPAFKAYLDVAPGEHRGPLLRSDTGRLWTSSRASLRSAWWHVCRRAGIKGVTFHDGWDVRDPQALGGMVADRSGYAYGAHTSGSGVARCLCRSEGCRAADGRSAGGEAAFDLTARTLASYG